MTQTWTITQTHTPLPTPNVDRALDKNIVDASKGETLKIKFRTASAGILVKMKAYNLSGEMVKKGEYTTMFAGWNEVEWDLKNDSGKMLGQGMYFIHIDAEGKKAIKRVYIIK
jgi:flagellar hook assembly protein FlgD